MKVLIVLQHRFPLWNAPPWFSERLRRQFPNLEIVYLPNYEHVDEHLHDTEIAITWSLRPEQFALAKKLRWIHSPAAAVHQLMFPELVNSDVVVTNARQVHAPVVAEHVMGLMFALAKKIPQSVRFQQEHIWAKDKLQPTELAGATLVLIGLGTIGREVARRASALGITVVAVRNSPEKGTVEGVANVFPPSELNQALSTADFVVLAAPRTPATEQLMNAERFANLKPTSYFINVSRGALVDESALAHALRSRQIAGAALDVFLEEPLRPESPLWDLPELLITPHTAAVTSHLWERHYALVSENLRRFLENQPLLGQVDKQKGY